MNFKKAIFTAASPNTQSDDVWVAIKLIFSPWKWNNTAYTQKLKLDFAKYIQISDVEFTDSGRSSLYIALKSCGVGAGDEVILPSFTCVVVANAVSWTGARGIYLDSEPNGFNANYKQVIHKITNKTKAIIVQHTFGKKVDIPEIRNMLKNIQREDILIIEDFAHDIHREMQFAGDLAIFTFGIEKIISGVRGGAIGINNLNYKEKISSEVSKLPEFPKSKVIVALLNPIFWWIAIPLHSVGIGRYSIGASIRFVWRKLGFLGIMVEEEENRGEKPSWLPTKISPALAKMASKQLAKLDMLNAHRTRISSIYLSELYGKNATDSQIYIRFPIILKNRQETTQVWNIARSQRVTLGNWFSRPLYGNGVNQQTYKKLNFSFDENPNTLDICSRILNLPTSINISENRARELAKSIAHLV